MSLTHSERERGEVDESYVKKYRAQEGRGGEREKDMGRVEGRQ